MNALSQVDKTFFRLCRPLLWQVLDLRKMSTAALAELWNSRFLTEMSLKDLIRQVKSEVAVFQKPLPCFPIHTMELPEVKRLSYVRNILQDISDAQIHTLELEVILAGSLIGESSLTCSNPSTSNLIGTLSRFKNVKDFRIVSRVPLHFPENLIVKTIVNMKNLTSFSAHNVGYQDPLSSGRGVARNHSDNAAGSEKDETGNIVRHSESILADSLSQLKGLKTLKMYDSTCVDHLWGELMWQPQLTEIVLQRCPNLSDFSLQRFSQQFSLSLKRMDISTIGISERLQIQLGLPGFLWNMTQSDSKISFRSLRRLRLVGTDMTELTLRSFQDSPRLKRIIIDSPNVRAETLGRSIESWSLIKEVNCRVRGGPGSLDMIVNCSRRGIELNESFY